MDAIPFLILTSGTSHSFPQQKQISQVATSPGTCVTLNSSKHQPSLLSPLTLQIPHHSSLPNQTWDNASETSLETRAQNDPTLFITLGFKSALGPQVFPTFHLLMFCSLHSASTFPKFIEHPELKALHKDYQSQTPNPAKNHTMGLRVLSKHLCQT